jgi:hypothetical protein
MSWIFNDAQAQAFEAWYRDVLTDGVAWFYMKCKTPVGLKFFKCRFVGIYKGLPLLNPVFGVIQQLLS